MNTVNGMETLTSKDGTKIAYKVTGSGPPLVLLHGSGVSDHRRWEIAGVRPSLAEHFTVYAIDRRGRGMSGDAAEYAFEREVEDVTAVVENIDEPVTLLGHSYGALIALETAFRTDKIAKLILYEPLFSVDGQQLTPDNVLEEMYRQGKARAIGVSNFDAGHLKELLELAEIAPMINQVEFHPYLQQPELLQYCRKHGIQHQGWSPLMVGNIGDVKEIVRIAEVHDKTPAQVAIRWALQSGSVTIPKSSKRHRIEENADVFDFELNTEEIQTINQLDCHQRIGPDPQMFSANWENNEKL